MSPNQLKAYEDATKTGLSGRELEAAILVKAAQKLKLCQENWEADDIGRRLDEALRYNQKLWTFFQSQLIEPDNPLPAPIKQNLLNLSIFIDKRTFETMADPTPEKLTVLININLNLAAGLRETAEKAEKEGA